MPATGCCSRRAGLEVAHQHPRAGRPALAGWYAWQLINLTSCKLSSGDTLPCSRREVSGWVKPSLLALIARRAFTAAYCASTIHIVELQGCCLCRQGHHWPGTDRLWQDGRLCSPNIAGAFSLRLSQLQASLTHQMEASMKEARASYGAHRACAVSCCLPAYSGNTSRAVGPAYRHILLLGLYASRRDVSGEDNRQPSHWRTCSSCSCNMCAERCACTAGPAGQAAGALCAGALAHARAGHPDRRAV